MGVHARTLCALCTRETSPLTSVHTVSTLSHHRSTTAHSHTRCYSHFAPSSTQSAAPNIQELDLRSNHLLELPEVGPGGGASSIDSTSLKAPCFQQLNLRVAYITLNPNPTFELAPLHRGARGAAHPAQHQAQLQQAHRIPDSPHPAAPVRPQRCSIGCTHQVDPAC